MDQAPTLTRRRLLATVAALAAVPGGAFPPRAFAQAGGSAPLSFHIVDGWILTNRDLDALGLHAP
jgi:hypothetical protein